jgi:hypothetical protein
MDPKRNRLSISVFSDIRISLIKCDIYVDKTLFIKDIIDEIMRIIINLRPNGFGKTSILSM